MASRRFTREQLQAMPRGRFVYPHTVRLQEVDAAGVVFFAEILALFNDALLAWLEASGHAAPTLMTEQRLLAPVKHAEADYFAPARFGDKLEIELVGALVEPTEFCFGYRMSRPADRTVLAVGQTVHVMVSADGFMRVPIPDRLATAAQELGAPTV